MRLCTQQLSLLLSWAQVELPTLETFPLTPFVSCCVVSCHIISNHIVSSCHVMSCHTMSCRFVSCRVKVISTNAVLHVNQSEVRSILAVNGYARATVEPGLLGCPLRGGDSDWGWASFR